MNLNFSFSHLGSSFRRLLLYHVRFIGMVIIIVGLIVSVGIAGSTLFNLSSLDNSGQFTTTKPLNTVVLEELELWIENRNNALNNPFALPNREIFVKQSDTVR